MSQIKDKKRWFAANFCTPHIKCAENRFTGLGAIGLVGCLVLGLMVIAAVSVFAPEHVTLFGAAGIVRKSLDLKRKADAIYEKAKAIFTASEKAERELSAQERTDLDTMNAEVDTILADVRRYEKIENHEAGRAGNPTAPTPALADDEPTETRKPVKVFQTLGHQMQAIYKWKVNGDEESRSKLMAVAAGANEKIESEGGILVQADFAAAIEKRMNDVGQLLPLISAIEVSGNALVERVIDETSRATGSRWGGIQGYWVDEAEAITASKPKFTKIKTELQKVAALGYASDELLEDYPAMSGLFEEGFAEELLFLVEDAIYEGDGAGKPLGITHPTNPCRIEVAKEAGQAADTIVTANLSKMWSRMHSRSRANAIWLYNQDLDQYFDTLSIPAGTGALEPRFVTYSESGILKIKGRPAIAIEYAAAGGDVGDICLADLTQYRLIKKGGVHQASSMHVRFTTDEMAFRATWRVGGQPKWKSALTRFKGTGTVSPFVTLAAR